MIVDDHEVVREGLKKLLEVYPEIEVVATVANGKECLDELNRLTPDVVLMDISIPGVSGMETTRLACEKAPGIKVIMLTIYDDDQHVLKAVYSATILFKHVRVGNENFVLGKITWRLVLRAPSVGSLTGTAIR